MTGTGPRPWQLAANWRHAAPVVDGKVREQRGQVIPLALLRLVEGKGGRVARGGYFWAILKVYRVAKCTAGPGVRCTGGCLRAPQGEWPVYDSPVADA